MCKRSVCVSLLLLTVGLAQAKEVVWQKAVYSDARYGTAWQGGSDATRDALVAAGYTLLNADQLKTWMTARIADKAFSVVVFCRDAAPDTVTETMSSSCTLRRYLDAGGKIVWYGDIPFYYQTNATAALTTWGDSGAPAILGFNTSSATRDSGNTSTITPLGTAWGLTATWTSQRPAAPTVTDNLEILAKDNAGNACAWAKHYVPNDTFRGFVRFRDTGGQAVVEDIIRVAEYVAQKAWNPMPSNGQAAVAAPLLTWNAGPFALWHDVYFGTNPTPGETEHIGKQLFPIYYHVAGLQPGATYYWRIDEIEADGTVCTGDVWSFVAQAETAYYPTPANNAGNVSSGVALTWLPGKGTLKHHLYLSDDPEAVKQGAANADKGELTNATYTSPDIQEGTTYYWRVDELLVGGGVKTGEVWSFTTSILVDNMESYTDDEGSRIYETWVDGWTNGTGSTVGNTTAPFAEQTIIHGGKQSMPMDFDNSKTPFYSEAELELSSLQNWTINDMNALSLWVRGYPAVAGVAVAETAGKITLTGDGSDIWNNSDEFVYAYKTLDGNGSIVARVVSIGAGSNTWAKAGVMIRDSLNGGSTFVNMVMTANSDGAAGNGASFQYRLAANGGCVNTDSATVVKPPYWVKIERTGDNLSGSYSADGKTWRSVGTPQTITMAAPVFIGLCVTSHASGEQRTFEFDSISATGGVTGPWQGAQIASAQYNDAGSLYVVVQDSAGKIATATNATAVNAAAWTEWKIPLSDLTGVNLAKVKKLYIGVGDRKNPVAGGTGRIYIDDIQVIK